jgi:pantetheine-phosphate adenylyltransferase
MVRERVGIYPGTFDPIHNGHIDVIRRAATLVDRLIVAVAINAGKEPLFTLEERTRMAAAEIDALMAANIVNGTRIEVRPFETLLVKFAADNGADTIVRGLRAVSDFEYEFQMAANNKRIYPRVETGVPDGVRDGAVHLLALRQDDPRLRGRRVELRPAGRRAAGSTASAGGSRPARARCGPTCSTSTCRLS